MPACLYIHLSLVITQKEVIQRRREQIYEFHWRGLSQREIAKTLNISQKTVCNDLIWLEKNANEEIHQARKRIALDYKETCDIFKYLLRKALEQFEKAEKDNEEDRMERLYPIIESLNANLYAVKTTGDLVEKELEHRRQQAKRLEKELVEENTTNNDQSRRRTN